jgi:hypothetical protein
VTAWWKQLIFDQSAVFEFHPSQKFVEEWVGKYSGNGKSWATFFKFIPLFGRIPGGIIGADRAREVTKRFGNAFADTLAACANDARGTVPLIRSEREVAQKFRNYGPLRIKSRFLRRLSLVFHLAETAEKH